MMLFGFQRLRTRVLPVLVILLVIPMQLSALTPIPSAREDALGDAHPVLADDFATVFSNPAGIAEIDPVHRFSQVDVRLSGTFWNMYNAFAENDPAVVISLSDGNYMGLGILGPIDVGYAGDGSAFRLLSYSSMDAFYPSAAVQSKFTFSIGAQFSGGWGKSYSVGRNSILDFGFTLRGFYEQRYLGEADVVDFVGLLAYPEYFLDFPYEVTPGIGLDSSILFRIGPQWSVGMTVNDLLTLDFVTRYDTLRSAQEGNAPDSFSTGIRLPYISIGGGWFPAFTDNIKWFSFEAVYLSFRNLLGGLEAYPRNYLLGLTAGIEMKFWDFLSLRGGFAEGIFGGGLGFRFGCFSMDLNIGGDELSNQPGVFTVVDVRFAITFESRNYRAEE